MELRKGIMNLSLMFMFETYTHAFFEKENVLKIPLKLTRVTDPLEIRGCISEEQYKLMPAKKSIIIYGYISGKYIKVSHHLWKSCHEGIPGKTRGEKDVSE